MIQDIDKNRMPVTIKPSVHGASSIYLDPVFFAKSAEQAIPGAQTQDQSHLPISEKQSKRTLLQSSFNDPERVLPALLSSTNSFIKSIIEAYNEHHHLRLRPDDIWSAILAQFSLYVSTHSEDLGDHFVSHEGKKKLEIIYPSGDRHDGLFGIFAKKMSKLVDENIKNPDLRQWIMPSFSTSTENDTIVASVIMMGTSKDLFHYYYEFKCGFPTVTLLGEKSDYENIAVRLEKLQDFGEEPKMFGSCSSQ